MDFSQLLEDSMNALKGLAVTPMALPEGYAQVERPEQQGVLRLVNRFLQVGEQGEVRGVLISAPKIHIVNLFFFPAPAWDLPLYAMNFVVLGPRPLAAVLDAVCLAPGMASAAPTADHWRATRARYAHVPQAEDMPEWYRACRSGHDFFVRPTDPAMLAELAGAHLGLWRALIARMDNAGKLPPEQAALHQERLLEYKRHHRIHSPGAPLLRRSFGEAWTEHYLSRVLFV